MCGIAGYIDGNRRSAQEHDDIATRMIARLRHRGPDSQGVWCDTSSSLVLAHARLAIIDLSPAGAQPMHSASGSYVIVFNGEIYNFQKLRNRLKQQGSSPDWRGHSDTEVLLACFEAWGIEKTLKGLVGMFALALWDRRDKKLYLARDRMGEKPLYYGIHKNTFLFASELKALKAHPDFTGEIDREALTLYLRHNYIPAPWSIYKGIKKLLPGCFLEVSIDNNSSLKQSIVPYWRLEDAIDKGKREPFEGSPEEAVDELDRLLRQAVKGQMVADVPLGAFLSGGYDSTTVVALMQTSSSRPINTFTIGFHEKAYNEAEHAKSVARHLGTNHHELYITPEEALSVIPDLPEIWDEPFSDSSQIPTFLVSRFARTKVTVSLSGDGGDELFFGYERYFKGQKIWSFLGKIPMPVRHLMALMLEKAPGQTFETIMGLLPSRFRIAYLADRLPKLAEVVRTTSQEQFYKRLVSHNKFPVDLCRSATEPKTIFDMRESWPNLSSFAEQMMFLDAKTYLPDDILVKVDRATMAVSLESRVPLLDHRVVEFAWSLPFSYKYRQGQGKWLLRQVLYRYVPREMMERPKMGFGVPIEHWLRGALRDWAEEFLDETRLKREGFLAPKPIRKMWQEYKRGEFPWHYYLWDILMFQAWLEKQK